MFLFTDAKQTPWTIIRSDDKKRARIGAILPVLNGLNYPDKDHEVAIPADSRIIGTVHQMMPLDGKFMFADIRSETE